MTPSITWAFTALRERIRQDQFSKHLWGSHGLCLQEAHRALTGLPLWACCTFYDLMNSRVGAESQEAHALTTCCFLLQRLTWFVSHPKNSRVWHKDFPKAPKSSHFTLTPLVRQPSERLEKKDPGVGGTIKGQSIKPAHPPARQLQPETVNRGTGDHESPSEFALLVWSWTGQ